MTKAFSHSVGDGLHYITDSFQIFDDGSFQFGEASDPCILLNAHLLCMHLNMQPIWALWSAAYPGDPMEQDDAEYIFSQAQSHTKPFTVEDPSAQKAVLEDLRAIGCPELASLIELELK